MTSDKKFFQSLTSDTIDGAATKPIKRKPRRIQLLQTVPDTGFTDHRAHDKSPRPFILDVGQERCLHFSYDATQSRMRRSSPNALIDAYTRKMMAFLLFVPEPTHIVMLGLGGGSLAKYCYSQLPRTRITAIEIDPDVVALRDQFCLPLDDQRFRVICEDGARYLAHRRCKADVVLVDAFDADGVALSLIEPDFFYHAARRMSPNGALVMNLCGEEWRCAQVIAAAQDVFEERTRLVPVSNSDNTLLFAFNGELPQFDDRISAHASTLRSRFQLDFPRYLWRIDNARSAA